MITVNKKAMHTIKTYRPWCKIIYFDPRFNRIDSINRCNCDMANFMIDFYRANGLMSKLIAVFPYDERFIF